LEKITDGVDTIPVKHINERNASREIKYSVQYRQDTISFTTH